MSKHGRHSDHESPRQKPLVHKRRLHFILGSLVGALAVYVAVKQAPKAFDLDDLPSLGLDSLTFPQLAKLPDFKDFTFANLTGNLNRPWMQSTNFEVGRAAANKGHTKKHAAVLCVRMKCLHIKLH